MSRGSRPWVSSRLGDHLVVTRGASYKGSELEDLGADDSLLSITAIRPGGGFKSAGLRPYRGRHRPDQRCSPGDIVVALTDLTQDGSMLGSPAVVPAVRTGVVASHHVARLHEVGGGIDPDWLYYRLRARDWRDHAAKHATGTTVRQFRPAVVEDWEIPLPPLEVQKRVAAVLSAIDGKIDSNNRLAGALEAAASHLRTSLVVVGSPPAPGWAEVALRDLVEVNPRVKIEKGRPTQFVAMASVAPFATRPHVIEERPYSGGCRFEHSDVLMAKITGCIEHGKGAFADFVSEPAAGSTEFLVLRARPPLTPEALFFLSRDPGLRAFAMSQMTGTSGRQRVPTRALDALSVSIAPDSTESSSANLLLARAMAMGKGLWRENTRLERLREVLLPRLIAGELEVTR